MTLAILAFTSFNSNAQQQIKLLNGFHDYKLQASDNYGKLLFLIHDSNKYLTLEEAYFNDWEDAFLVVSEKEVYSIKARYHIFEDTFYMLFNGTQKAIYPHLIQGVIFKNKVFVSRKEMLDSGLKDGYYEVLSSGKKELLKKYVYNYKIAKNGSIKLGTRKEDIYIQGNHETVQRIDLVSKKIFDTFGKDQTAIKAYAKQNKLNLSKAADLKILFDYYNRVLAKEDIH